MDSIGDMLTRIRNAQAVRHTDVEMPFSNVKWRIAELLEAKRYVAKAEKHGRTVNRVITITLKYEDGEPAIREIRRISKPGNRVYSTAVKLFSRRAGRRFVLSTPKGIMTDLEARKARIGGEILFEIW